MSQKKTKKTKHKPKELNYQLFQKALRGDGSPYVTPRKFKGKQFPEKEVRVLGKKLVIDYLYGTYPDDELVERFVKDLRKLWNKG